MYVFCVEVEYRFPEEAYEFAFSLKHWIVYAIKNMKTKCRIYIFCSGYGVKYLFHLIYVNDNLEVYFKLVKTWNNFVIKKDKTGLL